MSDDRSAAPGADTGTDTTHEGGTDGPGRGPTRTDGGTVTAPAAGGSSGSAIERLVALSKRESVVVVGSAIALLALPILLIDGLGLLSTVLFGSPKVAGYEGLSALILAFAIAVIGFDILLGYTELLSFGHAAFWGVSAYTAGIVSAQLTANPLVIVFAGIAVTAPLAVIIGFLSIRRSGVYFAVLTLTFGQMLYFYALGPGSWLTGGANGFTDIQSNPLFGFALGDTIQDIYFDMTGALLLDIPFARWSIEYLFLATFTLIAIWLAYRIINSPYGLILSAIGENEQRVDFVGLDVFRYKLMAFVISAMFAGAGGALFAVHERVAGVYPGSLYWITSGDFVIMAVLGGTGSIAGPFLGALVFEYISNVVSSLSFVLFTGPLRGVLGEFTLNFGPVWRLVLGGVFVLVVAKFPDGIRGAIASAVAAIEERVAGSGGGGSAADPAVDVEAGTDGGPPTDGEPSNDPDDGPARTGGDD
ncbi:branched-chain amino acid ABC transporter permease [Haloglomus litoreum]|uniref:branched-chain amino acid ABC transporter permease n=1 Tax=Haloglomus litoreum TaxID=3034026 RepID=UPI0023E8ECFD|nr:branched-chain amino acid ABC transporter permease [Haloglomus sp. DT116]